MAKSAAKAKLAKKKCAAMKKAGVGIFAKKTLSDKLAAVCGGKKVLPRTQVTKLVWVYIKKNKLNKGRVISPDATLGAVVGTKKLDMLKLAKPIGKHLK
eukprot:gene8824-3684_t